MSKPPATAKAHAAPALSIPERILLLGIADGAVGEILYGSSVRAEEEDSGNVAKIRA
jgi:hypothetical protein